MNKKHKPVMIQHITADSIKEASRFEFHLTFRLDGESPEQARSRIVDYLEQDPAQGLIAILDEAVIVTYWNNFTHRWNSECNECGWIKHSLTLGHAMDLATHHAAGFHPLLTLSLIDMKDPDWQPHIKYANNTPPSGTTLQ